MTSRMTMIFEESYTKRPLNSFFFLAFCGVIYQNLLHIRVFIAVSTMQLEGTFSSILSKDRCILPLKQVVTVHRRIHISVKWHLTSYYQQSAAEVGAFRLRLIASQVDA